MVVTGAARRAGARGAGPPTEGETEVPKLGMGPIRREQICRAAAAVIAREGFAGTTMRQVADEAGVSTGMLNHYFANRQEMLTAALVYVSERSQERYQNAIEGLEPGVERLRALLGSVLGDDEEAVETWRVWIDAHGEACHLPALRAAIEERLGDWFGLVERGLEGFELPPDGGIPWTWRVDAMLTGLAIQALTARAPFGSGEIADAVVELVKGASAASVNGRAGAPAAA